MNRMTDPTICPTKVISHYLMYTQFCAGMSLILIILKTHPKLLTVLLSLHDNKMRKANCNFKQIYNNDTATLNLKQQLLGLHIQVKE
jgi:hypothetical protein